MNCVEVREHVQAYWDGTLPEGRRELLVAHIGRCATCTHELAFDTFLRDALRTGAQEIESSEQLRSRILRLAALEKPRKQQLLLQYLIGRPWLASCFGIVFSLLLLLLSGNWDTLRTPAAILLAFFTFKPALLVISLLIAFGVIYINERFLENILLRPGARRPSKSRIS